MATKGVKREDGVLKLVHLGWFVELYWKPVTAREVMEKNPKHSIARPDFLRHPWIVIQPDSVLKLGRVFYIIPNYVIYDLIKAYRLKNKLCPIKDFSEDLGQSPPVESGAKVTSSYRDPGLFHLKQQLPVDTRAKLTTMEQFADRRVKQQSPSMYSSEMNLDQQTSYRHLLQKPCGRSRSKMTDTGQDHDKYLEKEPPFKSWCDKHETNDRSFKHFSPESCSRVQSWLETTTKKQCCHQEFEEEYLNDSWFKEKPLHTSEYAYDNGDGGETPTKKDHVSKLWLRTQSDNGRKSHGQVQERKSCLRTQSYNGRKSHGQRVTFVLPGKDQEEIKFQVGCLQTT